MAPRAVGLFKKMAAERTAGDHTCSVCLELFSEPKVLPCCHTFCLKCLEKTVRSGQKKGEIACPQCRKTHAIPAGGLTEFLTDFIASHEIEVASLKSSESCKGVKAPICGECEEDKPLESYCNDCQNYLCHDCGSQLHKRVKAYRGHTVVLIDDIDVTTFQPCQVRYCATHKGQSLKLYCETCTMLICCDCAVINHRQHDYEFVNNARKKVDAEMESLMSDVNQKLDVFKHNLEQIKKVETAATGHLDVLKADVNKFFDELAQSIETRRTLLLSQAETQCQKDMKQIWADKEFHETFVSQISSVFCLARKARKCTSDVEMILTTLQSIEQLTHLKNRDWDDLAFRKVVSSTPKYTQGVKVAVDSVGGIDSSTNSSVVVKLLRTPKETSLGTSAQYIVHVTSPLTHKLVDGRSGTPVDLQGDTLQDLRVIVLYGNSGKELDNARISIVKSQEVHDLETNVLAIPALNFGQYGAHLTYGCPMENTVTRPLTTERYDVTIQLVCGGGHTVMFSAGATDLKHSFNVVGFPSHGARVKKGPDWKPRPIFSASPSPSPNSSTIEDSEFDQCDGEPGSQSQETDYESSDGEIGTVINNRQNNMWHFFSRDVVNVKEDSGVSEYIWGQKGVYEIELVNVNTVSLFSFGNLIQ